MHWPLKQSISQSQKGVEIKSIITVKMQDKD